MSLQSMICAWKTVIARNRHHFCTLLACLHTSTHHIYIYKIKKEANTWGLFGTNPSFGKELDTLLVLFVFIRS